MPESTQAYAQPFDASASTYDEAFNQQKVGLWLRSAVWEVLSQVFHPQDHVLELGCGTGLDAVWLANQGVEVTATDASQEMLAAAHTRVQESGLNSKIHLQSWDFSKPDSLGAALQIHNPGPVFDGVFSNFGGLNCLSDRGPLAATLYPWIKPGGQMVLVLMGPLCAWEILWYLAHGKVSSATRRFRSGRPAHVGGGAYIETWYPSPGTIKKEFAGYFDLERVAGLGFLLPPPYLHHLTDRFPSLFERANRLEARWRNKPPWPWLSDHYLLVLKRV